MTCTQQQLDDFLESLIALTDAADPAMQRELLARLALALAAEVDDPAQLHKAVASVARSADLTISPTLP